MKLRFRDSDSFGHEALATTIGAASFGLLAPLFTGLSLVVAAPAAAILGGSLGAALTRGRPRSRLLRVLLGAAGGTLAALGHVALSTRFGLDLVGAAAGGALGGLALGTLLASDDEKGGSSLTTGLGLGAAALMGAVGVVGVHRLAVYADSVGSPAFVVSGVAAGLLGLWLSASAGLRRLERERDPLLVRYERIAISLQGPVKVRAAQGMHSYAEVMQVLADGDSGMGPSMAEDALQSARALAGALLDTVEGWQRLRSDAGGSSSSDVEQKLADLALRKNGCEDEITLGHLRRAEQALRAQQLALEGLRVGRQRAEAALEAQVALLDRLRLAVAQYNAAERERFSLELSAVTDQVARLTDDLDSVSAALAEAESYADRRLLVDVERAGHRALQRLPEPSTSASYDEEHLVEEDEVVAAR
jgi:hypothetical protein